MRIYIGEGERWPLDGIGRSYRDTKDHVPQARPLQGERKPRRLSVRCRFVNSTTVWYQTASLICVRKLLEGEKQGRSRQRSIDRHVYDRKLNYRIRSEFRTSSFLFFLKYIPIFTNVILSSCHLDYGERPCRKWRYFRWTRDIISLRMMRAVRVFYFYPKKVHLERQTCVSDPKSI